MSREPSVQSQQLLQIAAEAARSERASSYMAIAAYQQEGKVRLKGFARREDVKAYIAVNQIDESNLVVVDRFKDAVIWMT